MVGDPIVVLAANCSVKDAAAFKTSLCAFSNHSDAVTLDVSAVERVDTATMQLLCAFVRDRSGRNQSVTWRGESQALQGCSALARRGCAARSRDKRSCRMTRILAVDDSPSMRDMVRIALSSAGFEVTSASDGQEALDIARQSGFDLVLSDDQHAGDGWHSVDSRAARRIRLSPHPHFDVDHRSGPGP